DPGTVATHRPLVELDRAPAGRFPAARWLPSAGRLPPAGLMEGPHHPDVVLVPATTRWPGTAGIRGTFTARSHRAAPGGSSTTSTRRLRWHSRSLHTRARTSPFRRGDTLAGRSHPPGHTVHRRGPRQG